MVHTPFGKFPPENLEISKIFLIFADGYKNKNKNINYDTIITTFKDEHLSSPRPENVRYIAYLLVGYWHLGSTHRQVSSRGGIDRWQQADFPAEHTSHDNLLV